MISIFYCFLDPVVKPRGDTQGIVPTHAPDSAVMT
ncbi:palindromic element RPE4 domain-containing protein [Rickettsia amblyommatis]